MSSPISLHGTARSADPARSRPLLVRLRSAITGAAAVLLLVGASTIGLHDWADAQLDGVAVHGSTSSAHPSV